jgi:hypothetical protein
MVLFFCNDQSAFIGVHRRSSAFIGGKLSKPHSGSTIESLIGGGSF